MTRPRDEPSQGWCSLRVWFDERELVLLRGAERLRGAGLARHTRQTGLRAALRLARTGQKLRSAATGSLVSFDEAEVQLLDEALRYAIDEIQTAASQRDSEITPQQQAVLDAFPELIQQGLWRSFGLRRELETLLQRLGDALRAR